VHIDYAASKFHSIKHSIDALLSKNKVEEFGEAIAVASIARIRETKDSVLSAKRFDNEFKRGRRHKIVLKRVDLISKVIPEDMHKLYAQFLRHIVVDKDVWSITTQLLLSFRKQVNDLHIELQSHPMSEVSGHRHNACQNIVLYPTGGCKESFGNSLSKQLFRLANLVTNTINKSAKSS